MSVATSTFVSPFHAAFTNRFMSLSSAAAKGRLTVERSAYRRTPGVALSKRDKRRPPTPPSRRGAICVHFACRWTCLRCGSEVLKSRVALKTNFHSRLYGLDLRGWPRSSDVLLGWSQPVSCGGYVQKIKENHRYGPQNPKFFLACRRRSQ